MCYINPHYYHYSHAVFIVKRPMQALKSGLGDRGDKLYSGYLMLAANVV